MCAAAYCHERPPSAKRILDSKQVHRSGDLRPLLARCRLLLEGGGLGPVLGLDNESLRTRLADEPWLSGELPGVLSSLGQDLSGLTLAWPKVFVRWRGVSEFNSGVERLNNKGLVLAEMLGELVRQAMESAGGFDRVLIEVDRLGGRKSYGQLLEQWGFEVTEARESERVSSYTASMMKAPCEISFSVGCDQSVAVTAAASCFAKLCREIFMEAFNRWWTRRIPGIPHTAGYYTDGVRFLSDIGKFLKENGIIPEMLRRAR